MKKEILDSSKIGDNTNSDKKKEEKIKKDKSKMPKDKVSRTGFFKVVQHIALTIAVISLVIVTMGSTVVVPTINGDKRYTIPTGDEERKYDDSVLFNTIFGNESTDILRLVTIRSQIETNGKYDPDIIIDVTAYNNRMETPRDANASKNNNTITASYYLGDLLKWAKYGFEYKEVKLEQMSVSGNALANNEYDGTDASDNTYNMLVNRYTTVDGQGVEELVATWGEYTYLVEQIKNAAESLYINYTEYLSLTEYYDLLNTNMRYCVVMGAGTNEKIYSNLDDKDIEIAKLAKQFKSYGRYISYDSDRMIYQTNTAISESTFNSLLSKYEYAYPDDCTIFISADMTYPVEDSIKIGASGFNNYLPYYKQLLILAAICMVLYFAIMVLCSIREGHVKGADGVDYIRLTSFDNSAIEIWIILSFLVVIAIPYMLVTLLYFDYKSNLYGLVHESYFLILVGICVFIYDCILMSLLYSLVRRIKGKNIWKPSWLNGICSLFIKSIVSIYDNGNYIVRSWVPYLILLLCNLIIFLTTSKSHGFPALFCICILFLADVGCGYFVYKQVKDRHQLIDGMKKIVTGDLSYKADSKELHGDNTELAECVNSVGDTIRNAVEQSLKDEKMKADLIANVSHDIRTPLTSIINYVDLIKRENITDEKLLNYVQVIDEKAQRLKSMTEDLIEASKVSSGNVELELVKMNLPELLNQSMAEFSDKFEEKNLTLVCRSNNLIASNMMADGKSLWRVIENLFGNIYKYAMPGTRVFVDLFNVDSNDKKLLVLQIRNMSEAMLPENLDELTERFIRGDESRTTEGSGLGLSIAKSLTELMGGNFEIASDGDMFKVELSFETVE